MLIIAKVIHWNDVRMYKLGHADGFAFKAAFKGLQLGFVSAISMQALNGNLSTQALILGSKYFTHPAFTDFLDDPVSSRDQLSQTASSCFNGAKDFKFFSLL